MRSVREQHGVFPAVHAQAADVSPPSGPVAGQSQRQAQEAVNVCVGLQGVGVVQVGADVDARRAVVVGQLRAGRRAGPLLGLRVLGADRLPAQVELLAVAGGLPQGDGGVLFLGDRGLLRHFHFLFFILSLSVVPLLLLLFLWGIEGDDGDLDVTLSGIFLGLDKT